MQHEAPESDASHLAQVASAYVSPETTALQPNSRATMAAVDAMTAALAERLEGVRPSLTCVDVPADGHCQYRAVCLQSHSNRGRARLRQNVITHVSENKDYFSPFFHGPNPPALVNAWCRSARKGAWGDNVSLAAMCRILKRPVAVWRRNNSQQPPTVLVPPGYDVNDATTSPIYVELDEAGRGKEHYRALHLARGAAHGHTPASRAKERQKRNEQQELADAHYVARLAKQKNYDNNRRMSDKGDIIDMLARLHRESGYMVSQHSRMLRHLDLSSLPEAVSPELCTKNQEDVQTYCSVEDSEKCALATSFAAAMSHDAILPGCGACGRRDPQHPAQHQCCLDELPANHWLRYTQDEQTALQDMPTVHLLDVEGGECQADTKRLKSFWAKTDTDLFHVHAELVEKSDSSQNFVFLCAVCHTAANSSCCRSCTGGDCG